MKLIFIIFFSIVLITSVSAFERSKWDFDYPSPTGASGNMTDTNASTECSGDEFLLGNTTCYSIATLPSGAGGGDNASWNESGASDIFVDIAGDVMEGTLGGGGNSISDFLFGWFIYNNYTSFFNPEYLWWNQTSLSFNQDALDDRIANQTTSTYHNPTEAVAIIGTIDGGTLADVQHEDAQYDGTTFNFTEEVAGLDLRMNFTGLDVETFSRGIMRYKTSNLKGDFPLVQMWSYDNLEWEDYPKIIESDTFITMTQPVFDGSDHVGTVGSYDGVAMMRIYKPASGNTQNHYFVDWVAIVSGAGLPIGEEGDPIFNTWLHNASLENNLNGSEYNITNVDYGFFNYLGSLLTRVKTLFVEDINVNRTITGNSNVWNITSEGNAHFNNMTIGGIYYYETSGDCDTTLSASKCYNTTNTYLVT